MELYEPPIGVFYSAYSLHQKASEDESIWRWANRSGKPCANPALVSAYEWATCMMMPSGLLLWLPSERKSGHIAICSELFGLAASWTIEMINWHEPECRRPDVAFTSGLDVPSCLSCGNIGTVDGNEKGPSSEALPEPSSETGFKLRWPSSLPFVDDTPAERQSNEVNANSSHAEGETLRKPSPTANQTLKRKRTIEKKQPSVYEPLDARKVRLLHLLPGTYKDPIRCKLKIANLAFKPEYEALSYTWADENGNSSRSQKIYVGDRHEILFVTANCANALRRLRFTGITRVLWVDAICINQNNTGERSHQVGLMQYIYATALRVLIYLGENPTERDSTTLRPWMFDNDGDTLDLRVDLSSQPYFTRVWVIQEIASARSAWVLYGSKGAKWQDILTCPEDGQTKALGSLIRTNHERLSQSHPWLDLVARPRHRDLAELLELLKATNMCKASDPRDKVFALLGLFVGTHDAGLVPDYSLNLSEVLTGITAFFLLRQPESWELCFASLDPRTSQKAPSWSVDWLAVREWHSTAQASVEKWLHIISSQLLEEKAVPGFSRDGALILNGVALCSLGDCVLDSRAVAGPPGVVAGLHYTPKLPLEQRISSMKDATWAQATDKIFFVKNLPDHVLVLRPLEGTGRYSFVAICRSPELDYRVAHLINTMNRKVLLTLSTWNTLVGPGREGQPNCLLPKTWANVKVACQLIKHYWGLKGHSQSQDVQNEPSRYMYERPDDVQDRLRYRGFPEYYLESVSTAKHPVIHLSHALSLHLEDWRQELVRPVWSQRECSPYLVQAYWDYGATRSCRAPEVSVQTSYGFAPTDRAWYWHPEYMLQARASRLGKMVSSLPGGNKDHLVDSFKTLQILVSSSLESFSGSFRTALSERYPVQSIANQDAARGAVEDVDRVFGENFIGRRVENDKMSRWLRDDEMFRWLRDSMNFYPDGDWSPLSGGFGGTWADEFIRVWTYLLPISSRRSASFQYKRSGLPSQLALFKDTEDTLATVHALKNRLLDAQKPQDIYAVLAECSSAASKLIRYAWSTGDTLELQRWYSSNGRTAGAEEIEALLDREEMEESLDRTWAMVEDLERELLTLKEKCEKRESDAWKMLLELVEQTEEHLLPLEDAFTAEDFTTGASKVLKVTDDSEWEDVYII